jgi:putative DNA primase/helicase
VTAVRSPAAERERILSALHAVPAGCDRKTWVRVGMAAKAAGLDFAEFDAWSGTADNYGGERETRDVWNSFTTDGGIGAGTLFTVAREHGWSDRATAAPAEPRQRPRQKPAAVSAPARHAPIPDDAPMPPTRHPQLGEPSATWVYRDARGGVLFYVYRFDTGKSDPATGKPAKEFRPLTFDGDRWQWKGVGAPRPLYGLDRLAARADAPVIATEGEKAADAAAYLVPDAVCIASANGSDGARQADWSPLHGRRVILWPDADEPGAQYAANVAELLRAAGATVVGVMDVRALAGGVPAPGWDAANALGEGMAPRTWDVLPLVSVTANNNARPIALTEPLRDLESVYHPRQIAWKKNKETGDVVFSAALGTAENLSRLMKAYGVQIRYNELSRDVEISVGGQLPDGDLARNESLSLIEDLCRINHYPYTAAASHLDRLASGNAYNPALDWINSRQWDGGEHIRALFDCLTLADESKAEISWVLFRKWLLGAAAILAGKARKFEHVLVLVDPHGGIGKTRFFNTLCPKEFQADGVTLNPDDKDSVLHVVSKWLVELGEIGATFSKSDIESLKAFLSRDTDELRPAYARAANRYQRRTAFFGSVNNVQFLVDDTNNRRFWPLQVSGVNYQHDVDVQQAWAEALARVEAGETWHLDREENRAIGEHNEAFRCMDHVEERILSLYDPAAIRSRHISASDALAEIGIPSPKQSDKRKASALLRKLYPYRTLHGVTVYHMPQVSRESRRLMAVPDDYRSGPF